MNNAAASIGIVSTGVYLPEQFMLSAEISERTHIPQSVIEQKMGILRKPIPGPNDHSCEMGIRAARKALEQAGMDPQEIDLVIYIGEEYKEYPVWTAALKLQQEIGATRAWGFDVALRCGTTIMALKVAKSMMLADDSIRTVLLAGGYRNVDLIDYENKSTSFMFNLAAGGGAILLQKGYEKNRVLESSIITDGSFSEDVILCSGGTKQPLTEITDEALSRRKRYLDVPDPEAMKMRLEKKSMDNFLGVIREALTRSGYTEKDIDYLAILHMKKSAHNYVLNQLGLREDQSVYLQEYGHVGQIDQILSLELGISESKIKAGDLVVLVSAGIGYAWGATVVKWG